MSNNHSIGCHLQPSVEDDDAPVAPPTTPYLYLPLKMTSKPSDLRPSVEDDDAPVAPPTNPYLYLPLKMTLFFSW